MMQIGKNKKRYAVIFLVAVLGVAGYFLRAYHPANKVEENNPLVRSMVVRIDNNAESFKYSGEVHGRYESQLAFRVNGKVLSRNIEVGSIVKPGDLLMQLDSSDPELSVQANTAQLNSTESKMKLAKDSLSRAKALYEQGALSKADYEAAQNGYVAAEAAYSQAKAQHQQSANLLQYCSLTADHAGTITGIRVEAGQFIAAATPVLTLVGDGEREVEINIPENRIDDLHKASTIRVSFWALPDLSLDGKVREVSPVADVVARTFKVRISLINPPPDLKLGMTATVILNNSDPDQTAFIAIPLSAIYQTGDSPTVWVINEEAVSMRKIKINGFDHDQAMVSEGLKDGDNVVTAGVNKLREGQKIRIINEAQ